MQLHAEREGTGLALVLVHGFTQTRRCWGPIAEDLATDHEVVRVDAPGHGRSAGVVADLSDGADLLVDAGGGGTYLGYSMGARLCLHAALRRPEALRGLVLLGGTAGIEDDTARAGRREQDVATAARLEALGLAAFLEEWLAQPLFAGLPPAQAQVGERLENTVEGLRSSLLLAGTGSQQPLWDDLARIEVPVLVLAGERDERYCELGRRLAGAVGANARFEPVPHAGHAAHLERPEAFLGVLRPWLAEHQL